MSVSDRLELILADKARAGVEFDQAFAAGDFDRSELALDELRALSREIAELVATREGATIS